VTITEAYIDESYDDRGPPILCLAGYVFRKMRARQFAKEWSTYLKAKGLPYFHMSECAHRRGVFKGRADTIEVAAKLIELTRELSAYGFAVTINEEDYNRILRPLGMPSAYGFALQSCIGMVRDWKESNHAQGPTSFFFEEGHKHSGDAYNFLTWIFGTREERNRYGYAEHAFVPKATPGLHPADFLAWNEGLEVRRQIDPKRRPPRADLLAMVRLTDTVRHYVQEDLEQLRNGIENISRLEWPGHGGRPARYFE